MKGLITRNLHVKYESPTTYGSRDIAKVKVFEKQVKFQGQGHKVKSQGLITRNLHVKYENPITYCSKDKAQVKVLSTDNDKVKVFEKQVKVQSQGHKV